VSNIVLSTYTWALALRDSATNAVRSGVAAMEREDGQDIIEYAVLVGGIALVAMAALLILGPSGTDIFNTMGDKITACITFDTSNCGA
jgi:Flp pilus assembly pilin Flp